MSYVIKSEMFYLALANGLSYMYKVKWESSMNLKQIISSKATCILTSLFPEVMISSCIISNFARLQRINY